MDPGTAAIVGALVGFAGAIFAALVQARADRQRWEREVRREDLLEAKAALVDFFESTGRLWEAMNHTAVDSAIKDGKLDRLAAITELRSALIDFDVARMKADLSEETESLSADMSENIKNLLRLIDLVLMGEELPDGALTSVVSDIYDASERLMEYQNELSARRSSDGRS